jgi:hypothetical protein
MERKWKLL